MKKAQTFIEAALLLAFVAVISVAVMGIMNNKNTITKLTNMSSVHLKSD